MALDRLMELAAVHESTPGTVQPSAYAAANAKFLVINPTFSASPPFFQRDFKRSSLTGIPGLPGSKPGTMTFTVEVGGQEVSTPDIPPWAPLLESCGYRSVVTRSLAYTSGSGGPFLHGETVSDGTASAIMVRDSHPNSSGAGTAYTADQDVAFSTGTLTGATSGATASISGNSVDAGQAFYPISQEEIRCTHSGTDPSVGDIVTQATSGFGGIVTAVSAGANFDARIYNSFPSTSEDILVAGGTTITAAQFSAVAQRSIPTITLCLNLDGTLHQLRGARGNVEFVGNVGEPMLMNFTFQGIVVDPSDTALLTGVTYESKVPPTLLGIGLTMGHPSDDSTDDFYSSSCIAGITINTGNVVSPRTCANDAGGIELFTISNRDMTGTIDPEKLLETNFPHFQDFLDGDVWRMDWTLGDTAGNQFLFSMPGLQTTAAPHGERDGQMIRNLSFRATGGIYNLSGGGVQYGTDNELSIIYLV